MGRRRTSSAPSRERENGAIAQSQFRADAEETRANNKEHGAADDGSD
jgi:hypothetical protein